MLFTTPMDGFSKGLRSWRKGRNGYGMILGLGSPTDGLSAACEYFLFKLCLYISCREDKM